MGVDYATTDALSAGVAYGHYKTDTDIDGNLGSSDVGSNQISLYAQYLYDKGIYSNLIYLFGHHDLELTRDAGISGAAIGLTKANSHTVQASVGYKFRLAGRFLAGVEAKFGYSHITVDGYTETNV